MSKYLKKIMIVPILMMSLGFVGCGESKQIEGCVNNELIKTYKSTLMKATANSVEVNFNVNYKALNEYTIQENKSDDNEKLEYIIQNNAGDKLIIDMNRPFHAFEVEKITYLDRYNRYISRKGVDNIEEYQVSYDGGKTIEKVNGIVEQEDILLKDFEIQDGKWITVKDSNN